MSTPRRIGIALTIFLVLSVANSPAADDSVAQRQARLLENLQYIQVPYLGKDLGPARSYLSPRLRRCYQSNIPGYPNAELNNGVFDSMITVGDEKTGQLVLDFRDPSSPRCKLKSPKKYPK